MRLSSARASISELLPDVVADFVHTNATQGLDAMLKCPSSAVAIVAFASVLCIYWSMPQHRDGRGLAEAYISIPSKHPRHFVLVCLLGFHTK